MISLVPYHEAINYVQEADVLMFRGWGLISWLIKRYGSGVHSHAAMAHWDGDNIECVEFREFRGGRSVSLKTQVDTHPDNIDVFRPSNLISYNQFSSWPENNENRSVKVEYENKQLEYKFDAGVAKNVTDTMLKLTGLPFGWKNFVKLG